MAAGPKRWRTSSTARVAVSQPSSPGAPSPKVSCWPAAGARPDTATPSSRTPGAGIDAVEQAPGHGGDGVARRRAPSAPVAERVMVANDAEPDLQRDGAPDQALGPQAGADGVGHAHDLERQLVAVVDVAGERLLVADRLDRPVRLDGAVVEAEGQHGGGGGRWPCPRRAHEDALGDGGQVAHGASPRGGASRSSVAGPTPHRAWTGSGCRKASSSPGATTTTPGPGSTPSGPAASAWPPPTPAWPAASWWPRPTRARQLLLVGDAAPDGGGDVRRRRRTGAAAPVTSRNASSRAMPSTSGVNDSNTCVDGPAGLLVGGEVAGQEDGRRAEPLGPHRRHGRVDAVAARLVGRRRHDAPRAGAAHHDRLAGQLGSAPHLDADVERVHVDVQDRARRRSPPCRPLTHGHDRSTRSRIAHHVTRPRASTTMRPDIFDVPRTRSTKEIGTSTTRPPRRTSRYVISIWNP